MKKQLLIVLAFVMLGFFAACTQAPEADKAKTEEKKEPQTAASTDVAMAVDTQASKITWLGTKPTGQHTGTFNVKAGKLNVKGDQITAGKFIIDIASLNVTDEGMDEKTKGDLAGHLLSGDFFDAEKHPTATFVVTGAQPYKAPSDSTKKAMLEGATHTISGNLSLKDSTKNVTFPAVVSMNNGMLKAKANFNIDRTQWGMFYGSDKSLGDKFIRPTVNIGFDIVAKAAE